MLGVALRLALAVFLGREAHKRGLGTPTISLSTWWLYIALGLVAQWILLMIPPLVIGRLKEVSLTDSVVAAVTLIAIWVAVPGLIAWAVGVRQRKGKSTIEADGEQRIFSSFKMKQVTLSVPKLAMIAAGGLILGALIGFSFKRYEIVPLGDYNAMRLDRLTGKSWFKAGVPGRTPGLIWNAVQEE